MWITRGRRGAKLRRIRRTHAPILPVLTFADPIAQFSASRYPAPLTTYAGSSFRQPRNAADTCHDGSDPTQDRA